MPGKQIPRRTLYAALGAVPASFLTVPLLLAWPRYVFDSPQHGAFYIYLCVAPLLALLGTAALWLAVCIRLPAENSSTRLFVFYGLICGLCAMMPWAVVFGFGAALATLSAYQLHGQVQPGITKLLFLVYGPVLIAIDYFAFRWRPRASNNLYGVPRQARRDVDRGS
jgi:hypothetical protein